MMNDNDPARNSFDIYYRPLVEIKYFNVSIDNTPFFDQLVKKRKQEAYEKLDEMSKKKLVYNRKFIRLFVPSFVMIYLDKKYEHFSIN